MYNIKVDYYYLEFTTMKKKIFAAFIAALLMCAPLIACEGNYTNPKIEGKQNMDYVVVSNGGSAVQFGNYVYYINGYAGYADEDGQQNIWGNVVKGGLFRAELKGGKDVKFDYMTSFGVEVDGLKTYESQYDLDTGYDFVTQEEEVITGYLKDDDGELILDDDLNPIPVKENVDKPVSYRLASKLIGTSGYRNGGLFIYDDYIYYSTPSNKQNRDGTFATDHTVFYRTRLDGTNTTRLYRTNNATSSSPYAFYKQGDKVYLTVQDGTSIISVTIGSKVESVKEIATEVTGVLFPAKSVYFKGIDTCSVEDFIYYTRAIDDNDSVGAGNVLTVMRPDGSEKFEIANGNTVTLKGVSNGYLFYQEARTSGNVICYTNLHGHFTNVDENGKANSPTYTAYYNDEENFDKIIEANGGKPSVLTGNQSGTALSSESIGNYTDIVCVRPDKRSNQVYAFCTSSSGLYMYDGTKMTTLYEGTVGTVYEIVGLDVYFGNAGSYYYVKNAPSGPELITLATGLNSEATFGLDVMGKFVVMFGEVDDYADNYALFYNLDRLDDGKQFVGVRTSEDTYDPDVELNTDTETEEEEEG